MTRDRVGRHSWTDLYIMWNMPWEGFRGLYERLPGPKPPFEEAWRLTGGNPRCLERLNEAGWDVDNVVEALVEAKGLREVIRQLGRRFRELLASAVEDPDILFERLDEEDVRVLRDKLVELNLIARLSERLEYLWMDMPPPERDLEIGIGRYYAWQTPLHREAIRRALGG